MTEIIGPVEDVSSSPDTLFRFRRKVQTDEVDGFQFSNDGENWIWGDRFEKTPPRTNVEPKESE